MTLPPPPKGLPPVFTFRVKMLCNLLLMDVEPWLSVKRNSSPARCFPSSAKQKKKEKLWSCS